jgi:hypothetical protein
VNPAARAYVIAILHSRAGDHRAAVGLGTYPLHVWPSDRATIRATLARGQAVGRVVPQVSLDALRDAPGGEPLAPWRLGHECG